jgi:tRNA nucleotidyltransferase (CCA-adding enzyme)
MTRPLPQPVRVYRVGGSVRDELLNVPAGDADWVVVGATPEVMLASGFMPVGKDFPVFLHPETRDEYALARTERKHGRGYRGFEFFATPDVTLEDDLRRRDLTINAMARAGDGTLIDPYGGADDLKAGVLRHVSPAFAEDPLRVLRVARFAARFGFRIADTTLALMRDIVAAGELATLAPERIWQELARGLSERHPSRMLQALRVSGALAALLPQIDRLYAQRIGEAGDAGSLTERALDWSAAHGASLPARYATLTQELDWLTVGEAGRRQSPRAAMACTDVVSATLKPPVDCRDAARLAARWHRTLAAADALRPAQLLDVIVATDALRRPERLEWLIDATSAHVAALRRGERSFSVLRDALAVVRAVDASAIAAAAIGRARAQDGDRKPAELGDSIGAALRRARIDALRRWRRERSRQAPERSAGA